MKKSGDRMQEQGEMKVAFSEEKILPSEDGNVNKFEPGSGREPSRLSAQEAAAKIWDQWWLCREIINRLQMDSHCTEIAHFPLY